MRSQKSNELFHCDFRMLRKLVFSSSLRSILKNPSTTHIKPHHSLYGELGGLCAVRALQSNHAAYKENSHKLPPNPLDQSKDDTYDNTHHQHRHDRREHKSAIALIANIPGKISEPGIEPWRVAGDPYNPSQNDEAETNGNKCLRNIHTLSPVQAVASPALIRDDWPPNIIARRCGHKYY